MNIDLHLTSSELEMLRAALNEYKYPACFGPSDREDLDTLIAKFDDVTVPSEE